MSNQSRKYYIIKKLVETKPLYKKDFPLILFWSPKAGCTSLTKWFFFQNNLLEKATNYSPRIHQYRAVFQKSNINYSKLKFEILNGKKETYKLIRNPYQRAVSSFLHTVSTKLITYQFNLRPDTGLSFKQFLYKVEKTGVTRGLIDFHIAQQYVDGEELFIKNYILLEDFQKEIKKIEKKYGLLRSPMEHIVKSKHHKSEKMIDKGDFSNTIITKQSFAKTLPSYESFYDIETRDLVWKIYQKDFKVYGFNKNDYKI